MIITTAVLNSVSSQLPDAHSYPHRTVSVAWLEPVKPAFLASSDAYKDRQEIKECITLEFKSISLAYCGLGKQKELDGTLLPSVCWYRWEFTGKIVVDDVNEMVIHDT